jgi:methyltransferase (TIGR00027 family)
VREDRASSTAALIAAATVFLARDPGLADLVPAGAAGPSAQCLRAVSPRRLAAVEALSHPGLRWAARLAERATVPGLFLHFMLRKRWIEQAVRAGLAAGSVQVVVMGAGFDTLALRLAPDFPGARFIEIDHPATQAPKRRAMERDGRVSGNIRFIEADLARERLRDVLAANRAYRSDARSVFVIEGVLMYLTAGEVAAVFTALSEVQRAPGRVVLTVMEPAPDGRLDFHNATPLVKRLLHLWSEPFKCAFLRDDVKALLARHGLTLSSLATSETLRATYLAPSHRDRLALAEGELLLVAERGG